MTTTQVNRQAAVFLDRDGTLIRDVGYLRRVDQIDVLPKVPEALRLLHEAGFKLVAVTNQSAIARGWLSEAELATIHNALVTALVSKKAALDAIYYCPHHPTEGAAGPYRIQCQCRKPDSGMIARAVAEFGVDPSISYVVGDQRTDIELARRVAAKSVFLDHDSMFAPGESRADAVAMDLWEAAQWIVEHARSARRTEAQI